MCRTSLVLAFVAGCHCGPEPPPGGCVTDPACEDALWCNGLESCVDGACVPGTPPSCDDGVACTVDLCAETGGGAGACASFADHDRCTGGELCDPDLGCVLGAACAADDGCDDGLYCNGLEWCAGVCVPGPAPSCDDPFACTTDTCDWLANACSTAPDDAVCQDELACNGSERCDAAFGCEPGPPVACTDGLCVEPAGACVAGSCDADGDGYVALGCGGTDCDDAVAWVNPAATESCGTTQDLDCDGHPRCFDPDCFGIADCPAGGCVAAPCTAGRTASPWSEGSCGLVNLVPPLNDLSTADPESTDGLDCLCGFPGYTARALVFELPPPPEGNRTDENWVHVFLSDLTADLDLFVLRADPAGACNPELCAGYSRASGLGSEVVYVSMDRTTLPDPGVLYVVVAEAGAVSGSFDIQICQRSHSWGYME